MPFTASHVTRTATLHLAAPPEQTFPLFEPVGEMQWAEGWQPAMVYPPSGEAAAGTVFTTGHGGEQNVVWTITRHDPSRTHLEYLRVIPGAQVAVVDICCSAGPGGTTRADVSYTLTALSEAGNADIDRFTPEHYRLWMAEWEQAINLFLQHGRQLPHHGGDGHA